MAAVRRERQVIPSTSDVRTKGQVWTPRWVADAMAVYLKPKLSGRLLDPAIGPGSLVAACQDLASNKISVTGYEIDRNVLSDVSSDDAFSSKDLDALFNKDFIWSEVKPSFDAIICNPPYLRHHRIPAETKDECQRIAQACIGEKIDRRAGLHVFFLLKALLALKPEGRLAFIVPADTFEGVFAPVLWRRIVQEFTLDGILTFAVDAAAFPGVDTNAVIVYLAKKPPKSHEFVWMQWAGHNSQELPKLVGERIEAKKSGDGELRSVVVGLDAGLESGLAREPQTPSGPTVPFVSLASVVRGVATGSNDFFLMTRQQMLDRGLSEKNFVRTIARVRDLQGDDINDALLQHLEDSGRPTWLLSLDANDFGQMTLGEDDQNHGALRKYLEWGENNGVASGALVRARRSWFEMEKRVPPPIVFSYLGRRDQRFAKNSARVVPLTGFLCVYPKDGVADHELLRFLNRKDAVASLHLVGKSYGDGAIKVEPGGLRKWQVPLDRKSESFTFLKAVP